MAMLAGLIVGGLVGYLVFLGLKTIVLDIAQAKRRERHGSHRDDDARFEDGD